MLFSIKVCDVLIPLKLYNHHLKVSIFCSAYEDNKTNFANLTD